MSDNQELYKDIVSLEKEIGRLQRIYDALTDYNYNTLDFGKFDEWEGGVKKMIDHEIKTINKLKKQYYGYER